MSDEKGPQVGGSNAAERSWINVLQRAGAALIPALLATGGLIGFVAFAGSVIVWTRFAEVGVPPDQVLAAYPRGELVAIATALLSLFGFVGLLAALGFYLIDPKGRATLGMSRGLLALLAVEGTVAILLVEATSWQHTAVACELFLLPIIIAFWVTFMYERPADWDRSGAAESEDDNPGIRERVGDEVVQLVLLRLKFRRTVIVTLALTGLCGFVLKVIFGVHGFDVLIGALALIGILPTLRLSRRWIEENDGTSQRTITPGEIPFTRKGMAVISAFLLIGAILPSLLLEGSRGLPVSLIAACLLVTALWRVAVLSKGKFRWYGLAVFISVPLFGTLTWMAQNLANPQVQPMALIRETDGPDESVQGLYVTETNDRVYFATVASEGCSNSLVPHSGKLLWVPKSEVVAMAIGPLQSVSNAAKAALEMSYALTPAAGTLAGDHVGLAVAAKRTDVKNTRDVSSPRRRLESVGAAVQPTFGAGLRLDPEDAAPGEVVTLRMNSPTVGSETHGFGRSRDQRTVRLGGIPVDVIKEQAHDPWDAEYVETSDGKTLKLGKEAVYILKDGKYSELGRGDAAGNNPLFVRLHDRSVVEVENQGRPIEGYLRLERSAGVPTRLDTQSGALPEVTLKDGTKLLLKPRLLRQAWHEDHIKFRVPLNATTGAVTVECAQLASQPLLRVAQAPQARIALQIEPGSQRVLLDSSHSSDSNGRIVSRHWTIEGLDSGRAVRMAQILPPSLDMYSVHLTVTDSEGQIGTAQLDMLRLPAHLVTFDDQDRARHPKAIRRAKRAMRSAMADEPPATIEVDARPGGLGSVPLNPDLELQKANEFRHALLNPKSAELSSAPVDPDGLAVKTFAYGSDCPAELESADGRLDVLVLSEGVQVLSSRRCAPIRTRTAHWLLAPQ